MDDILTRAIANLLWLGVAQFQGAAEQLDGLAEAGRRLCVHEASQFSGGFLNAVAPQGERHTFMGTESVDCQWQVGGFSLNCRFLEK